MRLVRRQTRGSRASSTRVAGAIGSEGGLAVSRRHAVSRFYPQVDPGAAGVIDVAVITLTPSVTVEEALRRARGRAARLVAVGEAWVLREDLARADLLGLGALPAEALARPLPVVAAGATEVSVRRLLGAGAPLVVVRDRRGPVGAVAPAPGVGEGVALGARVAERLRESAGDVLAVTARAAAARSVRAWVAGGTVRDALAGRVGERRDLDVVVEGDGLALARDLAGALGPGAVLLEHTRFLTASVTGGGLERIDVATARSERYERPGALPRVMPSTIAEDLARRDFTVNAMAVELGRDAFTLLDPFGGRDDVARRRIRVLHPLSFVEDPTRIFRAARYAGRLGFGVDAWTARAQALAVRLAPYPALSGQRVTAELELILADARPAVALRRLGVAGVFRLLDARYRFGRASAGRLEALPAALAWRRERGLRVAPAELAALALLADQPPQVAEASLIRLGWSGEPLHRLGRALAGAPALARALETVSRASARAGLLHERSDVELAWVAFVGSAAARGAVEWFVTTARGCRPALGGDDVVALGVPRGPAVAEVLAALRDRRLDGTASDRAAEEVFVRDWVRREAADRPFSARLSGAGAPCRRPDGSYKED